MLHLKIKENKMDIIFVVFVLLLCISIIFIPSGFEEKYNSNGTRAKARVISVENSDVQQYGLVRSGTQSLKLKILNTEYKGLEVSSINLLIGKMELDKFFNVGDTALMVIEEKGSKLHATIVDHYRINIEIILFALFIILLLAFAGWTGAKALLSFVFTGLVIWKILLPSFLKGIDPIFVSLIVVAVITSVIIFLVGGISKKGLIAFLGAFSGILLTCLLAVVFGNLFKVHGAVKPFAETLVYSGFPHLDLSKILFSSVFISSSGAVMDLAMDVSASMNEVVVKKPDISTKEVIISGFSVGKAVVGTMTTTLLLAYSAGFTALLMVFIAQGIPVANILNLNYVAAELLQTIVGSFGLVTVAPLTAIIGGFLYVKGATHNNS